MEIAMRVLLLLSILSYIDCGRYHRGSNRRPNCAAVSCILPPCDNPITPRDQCCPVCPPIDGGIECWYKNRPLANGQTLKVGCKVCTCRNGDVQCTTLPYNCRNVRCPDLGDCYNPYTPRGECCPRCGTDCRLVFCGTTPDACVSNIPPGECCAVCKCLHNGKFLDSGETIRVDCNTCTCDNGNLACTEKACPDSKPGTCPTISDAGICVEQCTVDSDCEGQQKCCSNGCGHVCMNCYHNQPSGPDCSGLVCPPLPLTCEPITVPHECCPVCRQYKHHKHGYHGYRG